MKKHKSAFNNILQLIGDTPLVKLHNITSDFKGNFLAKLEYFNPGHSSKDRIALFIIEEAERKGILKPGDTIIETTSGNTGFSIAMISIIKGYDCILAVSSKSSSDKIDMLKTMGARFMFVLRTLVQMTQGLITKLQKGYMKRLKVLFTLINTSMN